MREIRKDFQPEDLEPLLQNNGFDGCVAVQAEQSEEETVKLLEHANSFDFVKAVVGWVDLMAENVEERLELYSRDPAFKGARHTVWDKQGEFMNDSHFRRGIAALGKFDLTYDILAFDYQLSAAVELVQDFPDQKFVLDHIGNPEISGRPSADWIKNIAALGENPDTFCKISGLVNRTKDSRREGEKLQLYIDTVVESFGVDRLIFGSDWPVCLSAATYSETLNLIESHFQNYSEAEKNTLFGRNAVKFYNLNLD